MLLNILIEAIVDDIFITLSIWNFANIFVEPFFLHSGLLNHQRHGLE